MKRYIILVLYFLQFAVAQEKDSSSLGKDVASLFSINQPRIGGLIQFWNMYQAKGGVRDYYDSFRFRRIELRISGDIGNQIHYTTMVDFSKFVGVPAYLPQPNVLQDAYITLDYFSFLEITAGQFKYPLTYEGLLSGGKLDFVERAEITRIFGDKRDLGLQVSGSFSLLHYALGIFNGAEVTGIGRQDGLDDNREKDIVGRITIKPIDELSVGVSGYLGRQGFEGEEPYHRAAFEVVYQSSMIKIFGEALWARESDFPPAPDKDMGGLYVAALYNIFCNFQVGARYEYANHHLSIEKGIPEHRYTLGLKYFLDDRNLVKLQFNYLFSQSRIFANFGNTFYRYDWNNYLYFNLQVSF